MEKMSHNKWSFAQMTSNSDTGKTSGSGTMGVVIVAMGLITFLVGTISFAFGVPSGEIMTQSIVLISIGAGLLGYRKSKAGVFENDTQQSDGSRPRPPQYPRQPQINTHTYTHTTSYNTYNPNKPPRSFTPMDAGEDLSGGDEG